MIELRGIGYAPAALAASEGDAGTRAVLVDVYLTIEEGELVLVAGSTGSGKSTLLGILAGLVPRFTGGTLAGDLLLDGESIVHLPARERAGTIGYVGQDPVAGFVTDTVEEELAYGMEQLGLPPATMRRRVEETLDLLGIAGLRDRALRTLSGGEQQRVAIGSVLTMHPRLLVLDEPTSALDPTAAEDVLATVTRLVHDLGVAVVLAEHRLERVVPFADRMVLLTGEGGIVAGDPATVLRTSPIAPPLVDLGRVLGWDPLPLTVREARRLVRGLALEPPVPAPPTQTPPAEFVEVRGPRRARSAASPRPGAPSRSGCRLSARGLTVARRGRVMLREVDLELHGGEVTALMGRNGAGKSTLLWTLQGTRTRTAGSVDLDGADPAGLDATGRRERVALLPQTAADLLYLETVAEECAAAGPGARALLDRLAPGVPDDRHPRDLSEGQRLALALAVVLAGDPGVVLLDEPTRGLDYRGKHELATILRGLAEEGRSVMVATHDVEFTAQVADDVVVLAEGEVVSAGDVRRVVAESPSFAPQVTKVLGPPWLQVEEVRRALAVAGQPTPEAAP